MKMSATTLNNNLRNSWVSAITEMLQKDDGAIVLQVATGKLALPVLDEENNEKWIVVTISVPKGDRDGTEFDGYAESESFKIEQAEKALKERERQAEKERKQKEREAKKAEKEAAKQAKENAAE